MMIGNMKEIAQCHLQKQVTDAVLTIPAHFNSAQKRAVRDACEIAGIRCIRLISEPVAAAIADLS